MTITREQMITILANKTSYYKRDVKTLLSALDDAVEELFGEVTDEQDVTIQIVKGCKIKMKVIPSRMRVDPRTQEPIEVKPTCKPQAIFSEDLRKNIQAAYESKKNDT